MFIVNKRKRKFELGDLVSYKERKFSFGMLDKKPTVVKGVITGAVFTTVVRCAQVAVDKKVCISLILM